MKNKETYTLITGGSGGDYILTLGQDFSIGYTIHTKDTGEL